MAKSREAETLTAREEMKPWAVMLRRDELSASIAQLPEITDTSRWGLLEWSIMVERLNRGNTLYRIEAIFKTKAEADHFAKDLNLTLAETTLTPRPNPEVRAERHRGH